MRFVEHGPDIPDRLLIARDAGQVLFFCGAGVSQAEAGLPNFPKLAEKVLSSLGSALDSPARRLADASGRLSDETGLTGVVATDRIFGLLEQEFHVEDVREAVAQALVPPAGHQLDAHRILLDLSRDPGGVVRLITTNFDRLFEDCEPGIGSFNPPHLPDPRRPAHFRGVMHIHGRVDPDYRRACDDEFVLSSADFGRAYLADGWATEYIQALLQRFKIVFVGYSADDPPVQYLLEALNRTGERPNELFAFHAGGADQALAQWGHKGVRAIPYDGAARHAALWDTLRGWADRARNADAWHDGVLAAAADGPASMRPHERGMVAHMAATRDGARRLAASGQPPPAEWLCVLDPRRRYAPPGPVDPYLEDSGRHDPFEALGLDSDRPPPPTNPDDRFTRREAPADAWDPFTSTEADRERLPSEATGRLRDADADTPSKLPDRLWHLGMYIVRVAHQPAAVWWASHQRALHPDIVSHLEWSLRHEPDRFPPTVRRAWRLLIAAWREDRHDPDQRRFHVDAIVADTGWTTETVREAVNAYRPILTVQPPILPQPPADTSEPLLDAMLRPDVDYPRPHDHKPIAPEHLAYAVTLFRGLIEHAVVLEREVGGHDRIYFDATRADDGEVPDEQGFQLTGHLATFVNMVSRLAEHDAEAARAEFDRWPADGKEVFTRLRIWAAGQPAILSPARAAEVFLALDKQSFWTDQQERDLLYAMRDRWPDLSDRDRHSLERRLLTGAFPWMQPRDDLAAITAHHRLNRLEWLARQGVLFGFDLAAAMDRFRRDAPDWQPRYAELTAQPHVGKVRTVETDTDPAALRGLPLDRIIATARAAAGRDFETFTEHRPFLGLAEERPATALAAMTDAARSGEFPEREWASLLRATASGDQPARLLRAIGARLARLSAEHVAALRHPISEWLRDRAADLIAGLPDTFGAVWDALAAALATHPPPDRFRQEGWGWVGDGLNQPAGRLVDALVRDPARMGFEAGGGLPEAWKTRLNRLLALPGDARRHAIAMIAPHLNWLFTIDPEWATASLLAVSAAGDEDAEAFWEGYFWTARTPQLPLYLLLKPAFLELARSGARRREHSNKLAGMLLAGWAGGEADVGDETLIPDVELREVLIHADDELRTQTLWNIQRWANEEGSGWADRTLPFLTRVWPRQRAVRTPRTTARLVDLALGSADRFAGVVGAILPLLSPISDGGVRIGPLLDLDYGIVARHPRELLDLLWKVLPEDPWRWPYETRRALEALAARAEVGDDPRLAELLRRERNR